MSAVPIPKASAKPAEMKTEVANPSENARRGKLSEQAKYTDVKRTSSASFKPPMSKDNIAKLPIQPPPKDSSWFAPFSYIKTMFGSKSVPATAPTAGDKTSKGQQPANVNQNVKMNLRKDSGKLSKQIRDQELDTKTERAHSLGSDGREGNMSALVSNSNDALGTGRPKSPSFSISPHDAVSKRDVPKGVSNQKFDDDSDPNGLKYKQLQSVDNQSTYLHAPDKKGTTSFRITTNPKVGIKQFPTLLSPSFASQQQAQQKRAVKMNRKTSTSPHKSRLDSGSSRLRSKSTPDSSTPKSRPKIAKGYMFEEIDRTPPSRNLSDVKAISSWHSQQEYRRKMIATRMQKMEQKEQQQQPSKPSQEESSSSPLSLFFGNFMTSKPDEPFKKEKPEVQRKAHQKDKEKEPVKPAETDDSSPSRVLENAMEAISSRFSVFTNPVDQKQKPAEEVRKKRPVSPVRGRLTRPNERANERVKEKAKEKPQKGAEQPASSPMQSTLTMISAFVQETLSSANTEEEKKKPEPRVSKPAKVARLSSQNKLEVQPVVSLKHQKIDAETIKESNTEHFHRRPGTPSDYNIVPRRKRTNSHQTSSYTGLPRFNYEEKSPETPKNVSSARAPKETTEAAPDNEDKEELTLASAFQKLSSLVQSKISPLIDSKKPEKAAETQASNEKDIAVVVQDNQSPEETKKEVSRFYYLKQNKARADGNTKLARDESPEPKIESTFLKSRREAEKKNHRKNDRQRSISPPRSVLQKKERADAPFQPNSLSTYNKKTPSPSEVKGKGKTQQRKLSPFKGGTPPTVRRQSSPYIRESSPQHMSSTMSTWKK